MDFKCDELILGKKDADSRALTLKLLAKGRLCAYATLEEAGDAAIAAQPGRFEKLSPPLARKDYYLLFNPAYYQAHQSQVEALWRRIGELREQQASPESK